MSAHCEARGEIAWPVDRPDLKLHEKILGLRISEFRKNFDRHRPLSQADLAKRSGLSRQRINSLERGNTDSVRIHELGWIAGALGVPLRALFQRDLSETSASSLELPAYLTWTATNRVMKASRDVTTDEIAALTALCGDAERLFDGGQVWQLDYLLEQLLPVLATSTGTTKESQAQLSRLKVRMTKVCVKRVDAQIRQLKQAKKDLVMALFASH